MKDIIDEKLKIISSQPKKLKKNFIEKKNFWLCARCLCRSLKILKLFLNPTFLIPFYSKRKTTTYRS